MFSTSYEYAYMGNGSTVDTGVSYNTTTHIGSDYIEISGKRFSSKQLAYLLSKLLDEHPECQI